MPGEQRKTWEDGLRYLRRYLETYGDLNVPDDFRFGEDTFNLRVWITNTGARRDRLSAGQIAELDSLGFPWPTPRDRSWRLRVDEFRRAVQENDGDTKIGHRFVLSTGEKVGLWCTRMRNYRSRLRLSSERIAELDSLGFDWRDSVRDERVALALRARQEEERRHRMKRFAAARHPE